MESFCKLLLLRPIEFAAPEYLFPSDENASGHQKTFKTAWHATLRRAKVPYFRIYDLRSTYATRLSAVGGEWSRSCSGRAMRRCLRSTRK